MIAERTGHGAKAAAVSNDWTDRRCPGCGSNDASRVYAEQRFDPSRLDRFAFASRKLPEYMHYRLLVCPTCDLLYASPVPSADRLADAYRDADFDSAAEARCAARAYGRLIARVLGRSPRRGGALDIGAGDGAFLKDLLDRGFTDVTGVEPSAAPIAAAVPEVGTLIRHAPFDVADFSGRRFQLVTCFQTLEHVWDPLQLCRDAHSLLEPGGTLVCVVHNRFALSARLLGRRSPIFDIEHLQLFSHASARRLLESAGFAQVKSAAFINSYPLSYWLRLFPLPIRTKQAALKAVGALKLGRLLIPLPAGNLAVFGTRGS